MESLPEKNDQNDIYNQIRTYIGSNNLVKAFELLNSIEDSKNAEWHYLKGLACLNKGWYSEAKSSIKKAVELCPENTEYQASLNKFDTNVSSYKAKSSDMRNENPGLRGYCSNKCNHYDCCDFGSCCDCFRCLDDCHGCHIGHFDCDCCCCGD